MVHRVCCRSFGELRDRCNMARGRGPPPDLFTMHLMLKHKQHTPLHAHCTHIHTTCEQQKRCKVLLQNLNEFKYKFNAQHCSQKFKAFPFSFNICCAHWFSCFSIFFPLALVRPSLLPDLQPNCSVRMRCSEEIMRCSFVIENSLSLCARFSHFSNAPA